MKAWHFWYHCMCSTYGVWLRGDPRGWRTRHHREHVSGDYKHPPRPGTWERTYQRSLQLMKRTPVILGESDRQLVIAKVLEALQHHQIQVLAVALGGEHLTFSRSSPQARHGSGSELPRSTQLATSPMFLVFHQAASGANARSASRSLIARTSWQRTATFLDMRQRVRRFGISCEHMAQRLTAYDGAERSTCVMVPVGANTPTDSNPWAFWVLRFFVASW